MDTIRETAGFFSLSVTATSRAAASVSLTPGSASSGFPFRGQVSHAGKPQHLCSLQVTSFCPDFFWRAETLVIRSTSRFWRTVKVWSGWEVGMERRWWMEGGGGDKGNSQRAGGIRVSDFPLKLFYKLCKRFSLQQTLEHTRRADISVEHSQLKRPIIFLSGGTTKEPAGGSSLSEVSAAASSRYALAAPAAAEWTAEPGGCARWPRLDASSSSHAHTLRLLAHAHPQTHTHTGSSSRLQCCDLRH